MLYNGRTKWSAPSNIQDLIEQEPSLGKYAIQFNYLLLNERKYTKERLLTIRNIVSTLFLAEGNYDITLLERELLNLYDHEDDKQAVSLFLNWFRQLALYGKVSPEDYEKLDRVYRTKEEVQSMLVTALEQEKKKIYNQGKVEGNVEGEAKGAAAQRRMLLQFIHWRFQTTEAEQTHLEQQLAQINSLQQLSELSEIFLQVATLAEFSERLVAYLPLKQPPSNESAA